MAQQRIISIQHGDYRKALEIIGEGQAEPYFGMKYSLDVVTRLFGDDPHMIVSLDVPAYRERRGAMELVGLPSPRLPRPIPRRVVEYLWARQVVGLIRKFKPTRVLLRTGLPTVLRLALRECNRQNLDTLVILANIMSSDGPREVIDLLNAPNVFKVGNHKVVATRSLVEAGVDPAKAVAWDWPGQRDAADYPPKELGRGPHQLVYVGVLDLRKGVDTLLDAVPILLAAGVDLRLSLIGAGPHRDQLEEKARALPEGIVSFKGRLSNDEVFDAMRGATLIFVPTKHEFPEGMPLTLTEGLASRTPVISSDHPVMVRAFQDGVGLRFFRECDPKGLAEAALSALKDPETYRQLSLTTADALAAVSVSASFGDLIDDWQAHRAPKG